MEVLQEYPAELFADLYNDLESITIKYKNGRSSRMGFPKHRATVFGLTKQRFTGRTELSADSLKYPEIYNELLRIGNIICPIPFNSIYVNHNVICPLHRDGKNIGKSLIVSFGDYTGCKLVVDGSEIDTDCRPVVFNGSELEHWNTDDLVGNKYSLVFFNF